MKPYIKNNLGLILLCIYAVILTIGGLLFGETFLFWLPLVTILLIWIFDPLNTLSFSVRRLFTKYLQ